MSNDDAANTGAAGESAYAMEDLPNGWQVGRFAHLSAVAGLAHAVTTRSALDVDRIAAEREEAAGLVAEALGLAGVAYCQQVHGAAVHRADAPGLAGEGDGLVTDMPGVGVMCFSADCPLVLVADTAGSAVGIAHASWRSTVQLVTARLIEKLGKEFGCEPANLVAAISPSAGPCCYQVGPEVVEKATRELGLMAEKFFCVAGGSFIFDLWGLNRRQLMTAGVGAENIGVARVCTMCNNDTYPSYRKEGDAAGRFVAVIGRLGE